MPGTKTQQAFINQIAPGAIAATADAGVLDRCEIWVSLARALVEVGVPGAFVVDLR